ncbi:MAG: Holliday junction branch migration protein RuvA [Deltaproteobacteria bacterium]|nr:Holliday junction branch migration protein RuvA [Deltaproteobacteria bacterium]
MIARLRGILSYKSTNFIIIDVNGVGYGIQVPLSTFYELPEAGEKVSLVIHTHLKEDSINLFGFLNEREKRMFELMITVSGIGPRLAMNVLSGISTDRLEEALSTGDLRHLVAVPGVGRKTAERMILELKDKVNRVLAEVDPALAKISPLEEDALSALINLGYKAATAKKAISTVISMEQDALTLEKVLMDALKILSP